MEIMPLTPDEVLELQVNRDKISDNIRFFYIPDEHIARLQQVERLVNAYTGKSFYAFCAEHNYDPLALALIKLIPHGVYSSTVRALVLQFDTLQAIFDWERVRGGSFMNDRRRPEEKILHVLEGWVGEDVLYDRYLGNLYSKGQVNPYGKIELVGGNRNRKFKTGRDIPTNDPNLKLITPTGELLIEVITTFNKCLIEQQVISLRGAKYHNLAWLYEKQGFDTMVLFLYPATGVYIHKLASVMIQDIMADPSCKNAKMIDSYLIKFGEQAQFKPMNSLIQPYMQSL